MTDLHQFAISDTASPAETHCAALSAPCASVYKQLEGNDHNSCGLTPFLSLRGQTFPLFHFLATNILPLSPTSASFWLFQNKRMHILEKQELYLALQNNNRVILVTNVWIRGVEISQNKHFAEISWACCCGASAPVSWGWLMPLCRHHHVL